MIDVISTTLNNILTTLYQSFWFALIMAVLTMFFYFFSTDAQNAGKGWKHSLKIFCCCFKNKSGFRRLFFLVFYTSLVLFRTLINRTIWVNPLSNVLGNWWIYEKNAQTGEIKLITEPFENLLLFIPFAFLLLATFNIKSKTNHLLLRGCFVVFLFSLSIELLQLIMHLGTFQLSDLFFNTLGGFVGSIIYILIHRVKKKYFGK